MTLALSLSSITATGIFACRDLTPIEINRTPVTTTDGGTGDAGAKRGPCAECLFAESDSGPKCTEEFAACYDNPLCEALITCMIDTGCFDGFGGEEGNRCGVPCALGAGIPSSTDPSIALGVTLAGCSYTECPGVCFRDPPGEADQTP